MICSIAPKSRPTFVFKATTILIKYLGSTMSSHYTTLSYVTTPNIDVARELSKKLVQQRLAACVNIVKDIESVYEWQDNIEHDKEALLIIKSHSSKSKEISDFVVKNHPYECPEVVTMKVDSGNEKYLNWVMEMVLEKCPIPEST